MAIVLKNCAVYLFSDIFCHSTQELVIFYLFGWNFTPYPKLWPLWRNNLLLVLLIEFEKSQRKKVRVGPIEKFLLSKNLVDSQLRLSLFCKHSPLGNVNSWVQFRKCALGHNLNFIAELTESKIDLGLVLKSPINRKGLAFRLWLSWPLNVMISFLVIHRVVMHAIPGVIGPSNGPS